MVDYPDWQRGIRLVGSDITLTIRIEASDVDLNIVFTDQSVAVFDAAKWFAHQAQQIFVNGALAVDRGVRTLIMSRPVPSTGPFFITGIAGSVEADTVEPYATQVILRVAGTTVCWLGSRSGTGITFDTPVRAEAESTVEVWMTWWGAADDSPICAGGCWGYDEVA